MINFIENIAEFYPLNYFNEDFHKEVIAKSGYSNDDIKTFNKNVNALKEKYYAFKKEMIESNLRVKDKVKRAHDFHTKLLNMLGYAGDKPEYDDFVFLNEKEALPIRHKLYRGDNQPHLFVMEMQPMISYQGESPDGLFEQQFDTEEERTSPPQKYHRSQWANVFSVPEGVSISPMIINKAVGEVFLMDAHLRPKYILLLAGNKIFLLEQEKWFKGQYLIFDLETLFSDSVVEKNYLSLFYLMIGKEKLSPVADIVLMDQLEEESHKKAYEVTKDLKEAVVNAVEAIANEAVFYMGEEAAGLDADQLKNECLTYVYRLLFVFYAESREDLDILPSNDSVYQHGYSMEMLRDLEQVPLNTESSRDGFFFHESISGLFRLLHEGYKEKESDNRSFRIRRIDSPMFDNNKMPYLSTIKVRNHIWQDIISQLSLSKKQKKKKRGRISYANLGINQLGSVYESLLAYRGVFAETDQIEVHRKRKAKESSVKAATDGSYLVDRSRYDEFNAGEIYYDIEEGGEEKLRVIPQGTFTYRLSGRDRQKSASYYTPEVLTKCTVKYTLKPILERLDKKEMKAIDLLELKILEPAMGAAAFHNEVINQLSEAYLTYRQDEITKKSKEGKRVSPDKYQEELQKVKAYIALNNVYGVDLNPTAVELGKLSLWLNVIHKDMETPFFGYRLGVGNAVVGCWLKGYKVNDIYRGEKTRGGKKEWWTKAPEMLTFDGNKIKRPGSHGTGTELIYHFLLPDKGMVPSAGIKLLKVEYPEHAKAVSEWRKEICKPIEGEEVKILRGLCSSIDDLIEEHYKFQKRVSLETAVKPDIYGVDGQAKFKLKSYDQKADMAENREHTESPFFKLKMIMDYWCSLWYWDVRHAAELPTRRQWYQDIANILQVDLNEIKNKKTKGKEEQQGLSDFMVPEQVDMFRKEKQLSLGYRSDIEQNNAVADAIIEYGDKRSNTLFASNRLRLVRDMALQYRYFHYQLEFIEVFRERGGFDVAVGNPPWVRIELKLGDFLPDYRPEVFVKNLEVALVDKLLPEFLKDKKLKNELLNEFILTESSNKYFSSLMNYTLSGKQANLYKLVLENSFNIMNQEGKLGLIHPEGIYDETNGERIRKAAYSRLKYHFQFQNQYFLFSDVGDRFKFSLNLYSNYSEKIDFKSINNLFQVSTIDLCFSHDGNGDVYGIKIFENNKFSWNLKGHSDRVVTIENNSLNKLGEIFEGEVTTAPKLPSIHAQGLVNVLLKFGKAKMNVNDLKSDFTTCWGETSAQRDGTIIRKTMQPNIDKYELIYSGPHFYAGNPLYKTPREKCSEKSHYDVIDLTSINEDYIPRTNYTPSLDIDEYRNRRSQDVDWFQSYKVVWSRRINQAAERSLQPAIIPPKTAHVHTVISGVFNQSEVLLIAGLSSSIVLDFYLKSTGKADLYEDTIKTFPLIQESKYINRISILTLLLNCITSQYLILWQDQYQEPYTKDQWSKSDPRLKPFSTLTKEWTWETPLRNYYERRWALIEIDVITAMALSLTLEELILIYNVQFPVLQENESDTWYDTKGNIIFTCSKGLTGVGMDRKEWNHIRELRPDQMIDCSRYENMRCDAPGEITYRITKSELYYGEERTYYTPFDKCDRVEDYRVAWRHFAVVFAGE